MVSGSASCGNGERGEMYTFFISVYDHMHDRVEMTGYQGDVSLLGRVTWDIDGNTMPVSDGVCYFRYDPVAPSTVSYDITVS